MAIPPTGPTSPSLDLLNEGEPDLAEPAADVEGDITVLLRRAAAGDSTATDDLLAAVYARLEQVAKQQMRAQHGPMRGDLTLEPQALVHDTLLKLLNAPRDFANRRHFYSFATKVMIRVLQDYQRARRAKKRGGHLVRVTLSHVGSVGSDPEIEVDELPPILAKLEKHDQRKAEVVRLRVFWGLEMPEIAQVLGASLSTVERDWRFARHWLAARLPQR